MSQVRRVVLFPRFSAFASADTFRTAPINVREFATAEITAWRSGGIGTITVCEVFLEESADLLTWTRVDVPTATPILLPVANTEVTAEYALELPWVRGAFRLVGAAVSAWAVGNFTLRDQ
ncbi:MAG: hypothetical protein K8T90_05220 [Planctomycetes bacterium]|nr:hypothetical protein [Planctomycetota bacterium]